MPIAIQDETPIRHELNSLKGAWVETRKMNHGERTYRGQISTEYTVQGFLGREDTETQVRVVADAITQFDFKTCIVKHNLERASGKLLNLSDPKDIKALSGIVGAEIGAIINRENQFSEAEQDLLKKYTDA